MIWQAVQIIQTESQKPGFNNHLGYYFQKLTLFVCLVTFVFPCHHFLKFLNNLPVFQTKKKQGQYVVKILFLK
jgi:hypothetical protein